MRVKRIGLISPWYGGSHKRWADGLKANSRHRIRIFPMPPRHWKWRMHGAAVNMAQAVFSSEESYDLFLVDDMMDVAAFSALMKGRRLDAPIVTYFHENQISYPISPEDTDISAGRDSHYGYVNFTSCMASDRILFNSNYHYREFFRSLPGFLSRFPDFKQLDLIPEIREKSEILPLGIDFDVLEQESSKAENQRPLIVWNHRWEYDKGPQEFFRLLIDLYQLGADFDVVLLGERGTRKPEGYQLVLDTLGKRILYDGEVKTAADYARWLWKADIVPVTAIHDFFGTSVVEALYCKCHVLLPNRLAYPEHVDASFEFYSGYGQLLEQAQCLIKSGKWREVPGYHEIAGKYNWECLIDAYDNQLGSVKRT